MNASGLYIVNTFDRPCPEHLAERRADGKFYYVHPALAGDKAFHGMHAIAPTPVEDFGVLVDLKAGIVAGGLCDGIQPVAAYEDNRPRRWQGPKAFAFSGKHVKTAFNPQHGKD